MITKKNNKFHTTKKYKKSKITDTIKNSISKSESEFEIARKIFNTLEIHNTKEAHYYIMNKLYNDYLNFKKYNIVHFLLYCMLRFDDWNHKHIIVEFINFPARFPMKGYIATSDTYDGLNSFNKLLYLNNFIYHILENNISIERAIDESRIYKWGYNISSIDISDNKFYNIYYVVKNKGDVALYKTLISIIFPENLVNRYLEQVRYFIHKNIIYMIQKGYITNVYMFYNSRKLDYKDKFLIIDGYYIPKCNIDNIYAVYIDNSVIDSILYKETNYPIADRLNKMTYLFHKYRNIKQLEQDLITANITQKDFNDMMRSIKPLCFPTKSLYRKFISELARILCSKLNNFTIKVFGTSATFYSANRKPEKKDKFYSDETSDLDICIILNENIDEYIPILDANDIEITKTTGMYSNHKVRKLFGDELLSPFFNKWGPQTLKYHEYDNTVYDKTVLKRAIGLVIAKKINLFDYPDVINENKTCFSNFATFIKNGKTLSYWNENNELIEHVQTKTG